MNRQHPEVAKPAGTVDVIVETPGVQFIGPYAAGIVHTVSSAEAQRLIAQKGFRLADPTPTPPQGGES